MKILTTYNEYRAVTGIMLVLLIISMIVGLVAWSLLMLAGTLGMMLMVFHEGEKDDEGRSHVARETPGRHD